QHALLSIRIAESPLRLNIRLAFLHLPDQFTRGIDMDAVLASEAQVDGQGMRIQIMAQLVLGFRLNGTSEHGGVVTVQRGCEMGGVMVGGLFGVLYLDNLAIVDELEPFEVLPADGAAFNLHRFRIL